MIKKFVLLLVLTLLHVQFIYGQKPVKDSLNVLDYYKLLVTNALDNDGMRATVIVEDSKNGYLRIEGAFEGYIEVALFRKKDRSPILVVSDTFCGPGCHSEVKAYIFQNKEAIEMTAETLPIIAESEVSAIYHRRKSKSDDEVEGNSIPLIYELPRFGRTINVKVDPIFAPSDITVFKLDFRNNKFVLIK